MGTKLNEVGYICAEELAGRIPNDDRFKAGPVAIIECIQDIPCNPCEQACPFGAITVGQPITNLPVLAEDKCKGCGACIAKCPGLAIFVVDCSQKGNIGTVQMPYEYHPLPEVGEIVAGLSRYGQEIAEGKITKVTVAPNNDHTAVITLAIPKQYTNQVRCIRLKREG